MSYKPRQKRRIETARIVSMYALFGAAWIYGTDILLGWLVHDPAVIVKISAFKGSLFILSTVTILYFLINRLLQQLTSAETQQVESLRNYETIFNATNEAIFVHDVQSGRILDINDRMLEIYGYTRDEALTLDISQLSEGTFPYSQVEALENVRKAMTEGPQVFEWLSRKKTGELFWSEVALRRITTTDADRVLAVVRDISERKQLDAALRDAEWKFRALFDNGPIGVAYHRMIYDDSGNAVDYYFIDANDKYIELTGVDPRGKTVTQAFPGIENDPFDWIGTFGKVAKTGQTIRFEQYLQLNDRWYDCAGYQYSPDHFVVAFLEITERKRAEEALQKSEERFRSYIVNSPHAVFVLNENGRYLEVNPAASSITGYSADELLNMGIMDLLPPDSSERGADNFKQLVETGYSSGEAEYRRKSGETGFWSFAAVKVSSNRFIGFVTDITERKRAVDALASSERFLKTIIDTEPECIKMLDIDCNLLMMNPAGLEMIGADSLEQVKGQCVSPLVIPPCRDAFVALTKQVFKGTPGTLEFEIVGLKGRHVWLETHAVPFCNEQGEIVALLGITRDITESKRAEVERARLEQQLLHAQKLESLGVLAGGIAHDFNNILTAIMGNISYAKMDLDASQPANEPLARAEKAVKRATGLANQLLVFAKGGDPVKKSISVHQLVNDAVSLALSGTTVQAVIDLPTYLYAVNADEGQISQAFDNIIINAVQAMPDGGSVTISANNVAITEDNNLGLSAGDYVKISFRDEGCGIAAENVGRIFDPYFTTKVSGSGLGLASTYAIIKKHGGHISVSSSPGKGTTFTILIPGCGEPVNEELKEAHAPGYAQGSYSILVVDDDEMVRELAEITLKRLGYTVVCCKNGAAAVSLYRSAREEGMPFSLVIMDLTIPGGMGGVEAARQILSIDQEAQLIVSSGYSDDPVMANYSDYGFCASLEKPYNVEEISSILQKTKRR